VSSRVRLARNFAGLPFPARAGAEERQEAMDQARKVILGADIGAKVLWIELDELPALESSVLVERHLISKQHARGEPARALALSAPDERIAIMVNEEDHLRMQVLRSGLAASDAFAHISAIDDRIESASEYAYSQRFGYLTACPSNVGTGIRVSVMLHLPALRISGDLEKVRRAAKAMNLAVRGFYGEGSEAVGDLFQLSNQTTLGKTEETIIAEFEHAVIPQIIDYERLARRQLMEKRRAVIEDHVFRALGTLRSARLLKADEAMQLLSLVRLGVVVGLVNDVPLRTICTLVLLVQPAHLQQALGREMDQAARRVERATLVRTHLSAEPPDLRTPLR
jgi:protein arginine kinase